LGEKIKDNYTPGSASENLAGCGQRKASMENANGRKKFVEIKQKTKKKK